IKNNFILYPNGVDDIIHLKGLISLTNSTYSVYDMFGVIKRNGIIKNNQINVQNLPQGLYILKFESDDGYFFKKFIKN
ncbi:MAG TPA: T9SS type A sorting domain-containing protein, partial [Yeosuana sp.]